MNIFIKLYKKYTKFIKYGLVSIIAYLLITFVFWFLSTFTYGLLIKLSIHHLVAVLANAALLMPVRYYINKTFVYK